MKLDIWPFNRKKISRDISPVLQNGQTQDLYFAQAIKGLRARFEHGTEKRNWHIIGVTSAVAGEGKSLVSANLAASLAATGGKRVLLLDFDLRNSNLAIGLGISEKPGLSEFLGGTASFNNIVNNSLVKGLHIITSGSRMSEPADLLAGNAFKELIGKVKDLYDYVIIDTPPVIPVSDTLNLRDIVDGFIIVIGANFTPYNLTKQAIEDLGEKRILGVIINGVDLEKQSYYKRYYGTYYHPLPKK
jgi:capsular exopolysaccharide synthesis family protein